MESGSLNIMLKESDAGNYSLSIADSGLVTLNKSGFQVAHGQFPNPLTWSWQNVYMEVVENRIRVQINGVVVIDYTDELPLPPGNVSFNGVNNINLFLDDFMVQHLSPALFQAFSAPTASSAMAPFSIVSNHLDVLTTTISSSMRASFNQNGIIFDETLIFNGINNYFGAASWSNTGVIAFECDVENYYDICIQDYVNPYDPVGGEPEVYRGYFFLRPAVSQDGNFIAFYMQNEPSRGDFTGVVVMDRNFDPYDEYYVPNASRPVLTNQYLYYVDLANNNLYRRDLAALSPDPQFEIAAGTFLSTGTADNYYDVSSDDRIVYWQNMGNNQYQLVVQDGTTTTSLGTPVDVSEVGHVEWSPDNQYVYYVDYNLAVDNPLYAYNLVTLGARIPAGAIESREFAVGREYPVVDEPVNDYCLAQTIPVTRDNLPLIFRSEAYGGGLHQISPGTPIYLLGGYIYEYSPRMDNPDTPNHDERNDIIQEWWWFAQVTDDPLQQGYIRDDLVWDSETCLRDNIIEPPYPTPDAICQANPKYANVPILDLNHSQIGLIEDPLQPIRIYGRNNENTYYLISEPGILPQQWVLKDHFTINPFTAWQCRDSTLPRFRYTSDATYWNIVAAYFNNFRSPIAEDQYQNHYIEYNNRLLLGYSSGSGTNNHAGADLFHKPGDGFQESLDFAIYAQFAGVIVEAGPDGIAGTAYMATCYTGESPPVPRSGYGFYEVEADLIDDTRCPGEKKVLYMALIDAAGQDNPQTTPNNERYPNAGISWEEYTLPEVWAEEFPNWWLELSHPGAHENPGRQIVIWYNVDQDNTHPDIATRYYHVAINEVTHYELLRNICSVDRSETWHQVMVNPNPDYQTCYISDPATYFLGYARIIGFAWSPHLHYELYIDANGDGMFSYSNSDPHERWLEREDPLIAFHTIRR